MTEIKSFIFNLLIIGVSCAAVNYLAPSNEKLSKYIHYLFALIITVILISPIASAAGKFPQIQADIEGLLSSYSGTENMKIFSDEISNQTAKALEEKIANEIVAKFQVKPIKVSVGLKVKNNEEFSVEKINIIFEKYNSFLFSDTENYIKETFGCECEVAENEG